MLVPEEILLLILERLPLKSIIRFSHLSKQWRSLLSSSSFHDLHRSLHKAEWNRDFLVSLSRDVLDLCLYAITEDDDDDKQAMLVGKIPNVAGGHQARLLPPPSSGLICLSVDEQESVIVCNPMTHDVVRIPAATPHDRKIVRDPSLCLGFDSVAKQHKLVRFFVREGPDYQRESFKFECEVYTLGSTDWRLVGEIPYDPDGIGRFHLALVNGVLHWMTLTFHRHETTAAILAFDVHEERGSGPSHNRSACVALNVAGHGAGGDGRTLVPE
ncbi:putative F-box protein [Cocos nucifera]|nr:putative F-box protein [Cocos nucifera]